MSDDRFTTTRRLLEQAGHCIAEAQSAWTVKEDMRHVCDDVEQAALLLERVLEVVRPLAKAAQR